MIVNNKSFGPSRRIPKSEYADAKGITYEQFKAAHPFLVEEFKEFMFGQTMAMINDKPIIYGCDYQRFCEIYGIEE